MNQNNNNKTRELSSIVKAELLLQLKIQIIRKKIRKNWFSLQYPFSVL